MKTVRCGDTLLPLGRIDAIECAQLSRLQVTVRSGGRSYVLQGNDAIEAVMALAPAAMEGRRLRWIRGQWAVHNLVGHPAMQLLAWFRLHRAALWVHDATVPRPRTR